MDRYSNGTRRIILKLPEPVHFYAGQYLHLVLENDKFPFSIANAPYIKEELELHIRPTPGSNDSGVIEAMLDSADRLGIEIPMGDCFITEVPNNPLILIAASTGVAQMKSIIEHIAQSGFEQPVHLYWGVLTNSDLYLTELCDDWLKNHKKFHFVPVVSETETATDWQGRTGLVGEAVLADFEDLTDVTIIVSGGPAMVYSTLDTFVARGMPTENMKSDIFSYAPRN